MSADTADVCTRARLPRTRTRVEPDDSIRTICNRLEHRVSQVTQLDELVRECERLGGSPAALERGVPQLLQSIRELVAAAGAARSVADRIRRDLEERT